MEDIMVKYRLLVLLVLFLIVVQPGFADDRAKLVGIWKLTSIVGEFQDTGEKNYDWGKNPTGYQIFTTEGRQMFIIESEGRKPPKTPEDQASLFRTMFASTSILIWSSKNGHPVKQP